MIAKIRTFIRTHKIFLILFVGIAILRLSFVPELFFFGIDEEYQSFLGWSIVKDFHLKWIGLSAADTGFYVGPGLVYLHALLLFFSHGDPISLAYAAAIIGVLTTVAIYFVTKTVFGEKPALIAITLYGLSSFMNIYDRKFWNPTFAPLISVLMFYSLFKAFKNERWWIAVAFLLGVIVHIHASLFVYFLIVPVMILAYKKSAKSKLKLSTLIISAVTFLTIYSPLIVYDLNKNFENLKTPLRLLARGGSGEGGLQFDLLSNTLSQALTTQTNLFSLLILVFLSITAIFVVYRQRNKYEYVLLFVLTTIYLLLFLIFPGKILDYYLLGVIPFVMIFIAIVFERLRWIFLVPIMVIYGYLNVSSFYQYPQSFGLKAKKEFVQKVSPYLEDKSFYLDTKGEYLYHGGWRYLFKMYGETPAASRADEMFGWIYPDELSQNKAEYTVVLFERSEYPVGPNALQVIRSGNYTASIYVNE
ncbi:glycosyltransferase family 39 protein [Candidatus Roizmanbacteria bacterium]|nr:MAG: glycosyltransferase family 39 protein [Candidatus Roizmanbacteria bacterium]